MFTVSHTRASSPQAGFTLLEVVVSSAIMMIVFVAVLGTMTYGFRSSSITEHQLTSLHVARQTLEALTSPAQTYIAPTLTVGTKQLALPAGTRITKRYYVVTEDADGRTKNITVVVEWTEIWGLKRTVSLTTSLSRSLHR